MGAFFSSFSSAEVPPSVVLVPPLFESRERGRSRFAKSSYDRVFAQPQLRILFEDYLIRDTRGILRFSPPEDPRISVAAKLGVPRSLPPPSLGNKHHRGSSQGPSTTTTTTLDDGTTPGSTGTMTLRYQPDPAVAWSFIDVKARVGDVASTAALRACYFNPEANTAVFGVLPLVAAAGAGARGAVTGSVGGSGGVYNGGRVVSGANLRVGMRWTTPGLSSGFIMNPHRGVLHSAWLVGRTKGLLWGVQTKPDLAFDEYFPTAQAAADLNNWSRAGTACQEAASWSVAYQPEGQSAYGRGIFTAAVELRRQRQLAISFLHHMAVQRNVHNPFEKSDVVGITNYMDVAFQMVTDLDPSAIDTGNNISSGSGGGGGNGGNTMRLAAAWQTNKNVLLKGRVGLDGIAAAAVVKSWWQPSFTLGIAASKGFDGRPLRLGLTASVESYSKLRYERSAEGGKMSGARITQRHVASDEDVAYHEGAGLLVPLEEVDNPKVLGQTAAAGADYL